MAFPSLAGIMPATPAVPGIRFDSSNPFLDGYTQADRLLNQQSEEQRAKDRAAKLMWEFDQLREKALTARSIDDAAREAYTAAGMGVPPMSPAAPTTVLPPNAVPPASDTSYTTAPVADLTVDTSFDPTRYMGRIIQTESAGVPTARNPRSSATGLGQFIDSTWLSVAPTVAQRLGQDISGMPREQVLALRNDPDWSKAAILVLADQNRAAMEPALGRKAGEGDLRLAHGFGSQGALGILQGDPTRLADQHFPPNVMSANPHLRGKTLADIMKQYGITVPDAPGASADMMMGRAPTPEQQAASDRMAATAPGQEAQGFDWQSSTQAGAPLPRQPAGPQGGSQPTGIDGLFSGPAGLNLTSQYTNPVMQDYRRRLAQIPGAGAELMKSYSGEMTAKDKIGLQAFEYAAKGMPDMARAVAEAAGLRVDPRIFANRDVSTKAFEVLKSMVGQDPPYVAEVMKGVLQGQPLAQAWAAAGSPKSWREQYYGRSGSAAAPYQFINRSDGALLRVNKATGQYEVVIEPGRPEQARSRAANAAAAAVKAGTIQPQQMPLYMSIMERALMGDQQALQELEGMLGPQAAPADPRSFWERTAPGFLGGQPAPTPAPPPRLGQPPAPLTTPPAAAPQGNDPLGLR